MALPKKKILEYIKGNKLISENFSENNLEPASYDIRLGNEGITSSSKKKINIKELGYLIIEPGEYAVFLSLEIFNMPLDIIGNIGMTSKHARRGLILLYGLQIDPGYKGVLILRAFNTSTTKIVLSYREKIAMVQFIQLIVPAEVGYTGKFQDQLQIPPEDITQIIEAEGMTMGNVIRTIQGLIISITDLKKTQEGIRDNLNKLREDWNKHEKRMEIFMFFVFGVLTTFTTISIIIATLF